MSCFRLCPCPFTFFVLCLLMVGASAVQGFASVRSFSPSHAWDAKVIEHSALPPRVLAVDKKEQVLTLLEFKSSLESTTTYLCSTGQTPGDKVVEGDLKTPEGIYFVVQHLRSGLDFDMYGYEAYTLNYPNPVDKLRRKTGYGIWVHGKGNGIAPLQTQGCIALNNNDLNTLGNKLTPGMPIIISNSVNLYNPSGNKISNIQKLQNLSINWAKAWGDRSASMFDFYDPEAYSIANEPFSAFKSNKERLFKRLPWIKTSIRDIQVLEGPGYWVTWFYQDYKAPNLTSKGVRRLYWSENTAGEFKIIGMEWLPGLNTSAQLVREDPPVPPIDKTPKTETVPQKFDTMTAEMTSGSSLTGTTAPQGPASASAQQSGKQISGQVSGRFGGQSDNQTDEPIPSTATIGTAETAPAQETALKKETPPLLTASTTGGVIGAAYSPTPLPVLQQAEERAPQAHQAEQMDQAEQMGQADQVDQTNQISQTGQADKTDLASNQKSALTAATSLTTAATRTQTPLPAQHMTETNSVKEPEQKNPVSQGTGTEQAKGTTQAKPGTVEKPGSPEKADASSANETLSDKAVLALIEGWRVAWEQGNLKKYVAYYADNAIQDRRTSKAAIEQHKKGLWKRAHPKTVALANIRISRQGSTIIATMQQRYTSRNGTGDNGKKTLYLKQIGTSWRIVKETWSNN